MEKMKKIKNESDAKNNKIESKEKSKRKNTRKNVLVSISGEWVHGSCEVEGMGLMTF